jgi:hypothetical protein
MNKFLLFLQISFDTIINFPATFFHEISHAFVSIVTFAKIYEINIIPKVEFHNDYSYSIVYGYVSSAPRIKAFQILSSLAPFLLLFIVYLMLNYYSILEISTMKNHIVFNFDYKKLFDLHWFTQYILFELFIGGFPSSTDYKVALKGVFSISFLVVFFISILTMAIKH